MNKTTDPDTNGKWNVWRKEKIFEFVQASAAGDLRKLKSNKDRFYPDGKLLFMVEIFAHPAVFVNNNMFIPPVPFASFKSNHRETFKQFQLSNEDVILIKRILDENDVEFDDSVCVELLRFVHTNKIKEEKLANSDFIIKLFRAAKKIGIVTLVNFLLPKITAAVNPLNVLKTVSLAEQHEITELFSICCSIVKK